jgi:hypothetical protein
MHHGFLQCVSRQRRLRELFGEVRLDLGQGSETESEGVVEGGWLDEGFPSALVARLRLESRGIGLEGPGSGTASRGRETERMKVKSLLLLLRGF